MERPGPEPINFPITFKTTASQKAAIDEAAREAGQRVSDWIRNTLASALTYEYLTGGDDD